MGVIRTQTIKGTFFTYLGAIIGVFTNLYLLANFFTTEQVGLLSVLVAYSLLFAQFASLGFDNVTVRLFPFFRNDNNGHNGFVLLMLYWLGVGLCFALILFFIIIPYLFNSSKSGDNLFSGYYLYVIPLIISTLIFNSFDTYSRLLYKSVRGTFLKEFLQRLLIVIVIVFYIFKIISFDNFVLWYIVTLSVPTVILLLLIYNDKQLKINRVKNFIDKKLKNEITSVALFGIIAVFSSSVILNIDRIMIERMLGLSEAGIYSIAFFFGVIISIPSRALIKISSTVVSEAWKQNDLDTVKTVYYKSCINQMIISSLLFVGIWANIDNIFEILPANYIAGKYVIFWVCIGSFIDMSTGINNSIIATSKYYKIQSYFMMIFVLIIIITNYLFIPLFNITGAGIANALSLLVFNLMRWIFLWIKFKYQPFNFKYLLVIVFAVATYYLATLIPKVVSLYVDILIRSALITIVFGLLIYFSGVSEDINSRGKVYFNKLFKNLG